MSLKIHLVIFPLVTLFYTASLSAATIFVGPPPASIQAGINSAVNGDTVQLSAGTYIQEVQVISKSINLVGLGEGVTIIQAPPPATHLSQNFTFGGVQWWCVVMVDNQAAPTAQTVNISSLTVDGDSQQDTVVPPIYGSSNRFFAIGYHNANGSVENVHTTETRQHANFNELAGGGILNASNIGSVTFNVTDCTVDFYQRIGIDCRGSALTATVTNNTVDRGYILSPPLITATPNGIQFSGAAAGEIRSNVVSQNISSVASAGGSGIINVSSAPNVTISDNTLNNNDNGIAAVGAGNNLIINNNTVNFTISSPGVNDEVGIVVQDTSGATTLNSNTMNNVPTINMVLASNTNQPFNLMNNHFNGSQTGLQIVGSGALGPVVTMDSDVFVGTVGYYIQEIDAPNDVWPSTKTVSFDGLVSGSMTYTQFLQVLTKIFDKHNDPALGLVLDFIPPPPAEFIGFVTKNKFLNCTEFFLSATFTPSSGPNIAYYQILKNGVIVATISSNGPFIYQEQLCNQPTSGAYVIETVDSEGNASNPQPLIIL